MKRIDLDDVPPKLAALLIAIEAGEEVVLVRNGAVMGRLTGAAAAPTPEVEAEPETSPEDRTQEIFEQFRSAIEDEF